MLNVLHYDYEPADTPRELASQSHLVVRGRLESATEGRTLQASTARPVYYVVFSVAVLELVSGSPDLVTDGRIYFELPRAYSQTAQEFNKVLPTGDVLLFLHDRADLANNDAANHMAGRPEGSHLFGPKPQGFWLDNGPEDLPLFIGDIGEQPGGWDGIDTIEEIIAAIKG
jgi:hypothetical protein